MVTVLGTETHGVCLWHSSSIASFQSALKTHLFPFEHWIDCYMGHGLPVEVCEWLCVGGGGLEVMRKVLMKCCGIFVYIISRFFVHLILYSFLDHISFCCGLLSQIWWRHLITILDYITVLGSKTVHSKYDCDCAEYRNVRWWNQRNGLCGWYGQMQIVDQTFHCFTRMGMVSLVCIVMW